MFFDPSIAAIGYAYFYPIVEFVEEDYFGAFVYYKFIGAFFVGRTFYSDGRGEDDCLIEGIDIVVLFDSKMYGKYCDENHGKANPKR